MSGRGGARANAGRPSNASKLAASKSDNNKSILAYLKPLPAVGLPGSGGKGKGKERQKEEASSMAGNAGVCSLCQASIALLTSHIF